MKIRYSTRKICPDLTSLINTIGGEIPLPKEMQITMMGILAYNRPYLKTIPGPMFYPLCPVEL